MSLPEHVASWLTFALAHLGALTGMLLTSSIGVATAGASPAGGVDLFAVATAALAALLATVVAIRLATSPAAAVPFAGANATAPAPRPAWTRQH